MMQIQKYGWIKQHPDFRDHAPWTFAAQSLPAHFSLRDKMPPIWQQGHIGSCSAHGSCAAFVTDRMRQGEPDFMPSRLFVYYNGRAYAGNANHDSGSSIRDVMKGLAQFGAPPDSLWGYTEDHVTAKPPDAAYVEARKHIVTQYAPVIQSADAIKLAVLNGYPVVFGFMVYSSFEHGPVQTTGLVSLPTWFDSPIAGHAVCVTGWDSRNPTLYEVRNSWGPSWGDNGYMWFPEAYLLNGQLCSDFWTVRSVLA